ncbi:fumarylacetoacetate hydrolase family protein [Sansalvadorimonas verongulae]|uniref:fumarylacetoacetate hydrolase family protein n=1 Tax=Sansalvadorimonas verongulae TaxID=2172824 RepID=UPI0012BCDA8C|nr:fumarylacetoacetate hydrolase family protein [Sansalvadorimonas verongulae]MTI15200.1 FAA hydrolase family protein [Sansalvadorimonas verongulae]
MKLLRYGEPGQEKPGILDGEGNIRDLSSVVADIDSSILSDTALAKLRDVNINSLPRENGSVRYGPCVANVGKFLCIGLNYKDHAKESGMPIPPEPVLFSKFTSAICGPNDDIKIPRNSKKTDWEVELGLVIGKEAAYVSEQEAEACIAGYCVINDISEREFQLERSGQWDLGKGCDTFGPIGPWLVTKDEVADVHNLGLWLEVNGERVQTGNTSLMIFKPAEIVSFLSHHLSLQPGDIISTGTPPGVGLGFTPPRYLKDGDTMKLGIDGLGEQTQVCTHA